MKQRDQSHDTINVEEKIVLLESRVGIMYVARWLVQYGGPTANIELNSLSSILTCGNKKEKQVIKSLCVGLSR